MKSYVDGLQVISGEKLTEVELHERFTIAHIDQEKCVLILESVDKSPERKISIAGIPFLITTTLKDL